MTTKRITLIAALVAIFGAAGCSGNISVPSTVAVTGSVMYRGRPAPGVTVTLHPKFDMGKVKFTPNGVTDKDGRFTLSTGAPGDGAPPGEYSATFTAMTTSEDVENELDTEVDLWKGKYAKPESSRWPVTIGSSKTDLAPFNLD